MDLKDMPIYFRRYKICREHMSVAVILIDGVVQRFCQQCGRFHELTAFKGTQKTCEARLSIHNARRRANAAAKARRRVDQSATSQRGSGGVEEGEDLLTDGTDIVGPSNKQTSQAKRTAKYTSAPTETGKTSSLSNQGDQPEKSSSSPPSATMTGTDVQEEEKVVLTVSELMNLIQAVASYAQAGNVNNSIHSISNIPLAAASTLPLPLPLPLPPAVSVMVSETQQQAGLQSLMLPPHPLPPLEQRHQTREEQSNAAAQLAMLAQLLETLQQQDKGDYG